jgi:hypothetical protein
VARAFRESSIPCADRSRAGEPTGELDRNTLQIGSFEAISKAVRGHWPLEGSNPSPSASAGKPRIQAVSRCFGEVGARLCTRVSMSFLNAGLSRRRSRVRVPSLPFLLQGFLRLSVPLNLPGWCSTRSVAFRSSPLGGPSPLRRWSIAGTSMGENDTLAREPIAIVVRPGDEEPWAVFSRQLDDRVAPVGLDPRSPDGTAARASAGIRSAASRPRTRRTPRSSSNSWPLRFPSDYMNFYPSGEVWEPNV